MGFIFKHLKNGWSFSQFFSSFATITGVFITDPPVITSVLPRVTKCSGLDGTFGNCHIPVSKQGWDRARGIGTGSKWVWDSSRKWRLQSQLLFLLLKKSFLRLVLQSWPQNCPSCCNPAQWGFFAQNWEYFLLVVYIYLRPLEAIIHTQIFPCRHFTPLNSISILWCCLQQDQKSIPSWFTFYMRDMSWPYCGINLDFH